MKKLLLTLLFTHTLLASDAASILAKADAYRNGTDSFTIDVELTNFRETKLDSTSRFRVYGKGTDRSVVEFLAPAGDKGKYLLMLRDAMWMYMPATSRPIRISPLQRLMGQASNGDVARSSFTVDYEPVAATEENGAWLLDLKAKDPATSYSRIQLRVDAKSFEPRQADFYVSSGKLLKRAHYTRFEVMNGRRLVSEIEIEDLVRRGNRTVMRYSNLTPRTNPDSMFTRESLGKW